jgi:hypothetical protein
MISFFEGVGVAALGSTSYLEISLAAISPSCSIEDKTSSSRLQGSQLPPETSGIADFVSAEDSAKDSAKFPVSCDAEAWCVEISGSMVARGVVDITSKISTDEDGEARL